MGRLATGHFVVFPANPIAFVEGGRARRGCKFTFLWVGRLATGHFVVFPANPIAFVEGGRARKEAAFSIGGSED